MFICWVGDSCRLAVVPCILYIHNYVDATRVVSCSAATAPSSHQGVLQAPQCHLVFSPPHMYFIISQQVAQSHLKSCSSSLIFGFGLVWFVPQLNTAP